MSEPKPKRYRAPPKVYSSRKSSASYKKTLRKAEPTELKALLTKHLSFGDKGERIADIKDTYLTSQVTAKHWHFDEDAWNLPAPSGGGRELCFTAFMGKISKKSVLKHVCYDPHCVNPWHCEIMDKTEARQREAGTWEERIVAPEKRVVTRKEYEKSLVDAQVKDMRKRAEKRAEASSETALSNEGATTGVAPST